MLKVSIDVLFCSSERVAGSGMLEVVSLSQTSVLDESSTARVSLAPLPAGGSVLSQESELTKNKKAQIKKPNKRTIKAPPSKNTFKKNKE